MKRASLGKNDLIGKIRLSSLMTVRDVEIEVQSTFKKAMGNRDDFPFIFLQPTGAGSKSLTIPPVSSSFEWTPQQVAKLGANKQCIYILAQEELTIDLEVS